MVDPLVLDLVESGDLDLAADAVDGKVRLALLVAVDVAFGHTVAAAVAYHEVAAAFVDFGGLAVEMECPGLDSVDRWLCSE